jgi:hypothetical protein
MIHNGSLGKHQNILFATFGAGDISFARARYEEETHNRLLIFKTQDPPRKIGEVSSDDAGKNSDDLTPPQIVFEFTKPESITALVHSLLELQKDLFDKQNSVKPIDPQNDIKVGSGQ